jgi:hypothetical protein
MADEEIDGVEVDLDKLPSEFDELKPLIRRWAMGADTEREAAQEAASTEELEGLWRVVQPRFEAINGYLDENDDEEAHLLGNLAEGAMEAAYEIERRTGQDPMSAGPASRRASRSGCAADTAWRAGA